MWENLVWRGKGGEKRMCLCLSCEDVATMSLFGLQSWVSRMRYMTPRLGRTIHLSRGCWVFKLSSSLFLMFYCYIVSIVVIL